LIHRTLNRRSFLTAGSLTAAGALAGGGLLSAITGCKSGDSSSASSLVPVRLQADWYPQPEQGGYFAAVAEGFYQKKGLDVSILPLGQYASCLQVVASGGADFGLGSSDQILEAVANGLPIVAVGATMQHDPQAVMVHVDSPVHNFPDLEGHTVAAQPGATWFRYLISKYKLKNVRETPATHSVANFLADPAYIQQIFVTSEPYFVTKAGGTFRTMLISGIGYDPYRVFFTRRDYLDQHPEIVQKFVQATIQGWKEYLRNPGPANALILKMNPAQNPQQMQYTLQALKDGGFITGIPGADPSDAHTQIGKMTADRWAQTNDQLAALGVLHKPIDPTTAYTLKFLS
jgi:NitT/TauT family transport system substrate-binding protein